jgi:regulator of nucleoside diphosphate kinase
LRRLDARLEQATAVNREQAPPDLVTMNSRLELLDVRSGSRQCVTLVYPEDCDLVPESVSVFSPLGTQLLGSKIGDKLFDGERHYLVSRILYQPEVAGAFHL